MSLSPAEFQLIESLVYEILALTPHQDETAEIKDARNKKLVLDLRVVANENRNAGRTDPYTKEKTGFILDYIPKEDDNRFKKSSRKEEQRIRGIVQSMVAKNLRWKHGTIDEKLDLTYIALTYADVEVGSITVCKLATKRLWLALYSYEDDEVSVLIQNSDEVLTRQTLYNHALDDITKKILKENHIEISSVGDKL